MKEFVIKGDKGFMAIDMPSGGYPYYVDNARNAKIWNGSDAETQCIKYFDACQSEAKRENWKVYEVQWYVHLTPRLIKEVPGPLIRRLV